MRANLAVLIWITFAATAARAADKTVCVSVISREGAAKPPTVTPQIAPIFNDDDTPKPRAWTPKPRAIPADLNLPIGQDPVSYLKRLLEYFITHEKGFVAVQQGCAEHVDVELYPLQDGWTAFARYSGTGREERVDTLTSDELSQFAERVVLALVYDKPISTTILRDTVLRSDSKRATQRIRGTSHFLLGLGTQVRLATALPTAQSDGSARDSVRAFGPISISLGYRGKFEAWAVETIVGLSIGTAKTGLRENLQGGNIDYGGNVSFAIHFLRYLNPRALTSWYLGAGGSFEVLWFYQINSGANSRSTFAAGGFDIDLVGGVEFLRASRAQLFLQGALLVPAYAIENGDGPNPVKAWFPGASLTLGMLF